MPLKANRTAADEAHILPNWAQQCCALYFYGTTLGTFCSVVPVTSLGLLAGEKLSYSAASFGRAFMKVE